MADISHLTGLQSAEAITLDETYPANRQTTFQLPPRGRYTLEAPPSFPAEAFGETKAGNLKVALDPKVVGPNHAGFTVRRTSLSGKVYERRGERVSQIGDYLIAQGFTGTVSTPQEQADAVEATAGQQFQAVLDWRAENYRTGFKLEGMNKFPKNPDGSYQSWVLDPTEKDPNTGEPLRLLANVFIRDYLAPAK